MDTLVVSFWQVLAYVSNKIIYLMCGVIIGDGLTENYEIEDYALVLVTYLLVNIGRFVGFFVLAPILSRVGYGKKSICIFF